MNNLKINNEKFKRFMSAGLAIVIASNLTGCSSNEKEEKTASDDKKLETIVAGNKIISVSDLKLKDKETNKVLENEEIEAILVGNKLDREFDLIEIIFNKSVESILINDELVSVDRLVLVNSKTNEDIKEIDYALVADELIPIKDYVGKDARDVFEKIEIDCDDKEEEKEYEYEELTTEKFEDLVATVYKRFSEIGLDVSKEEVIDFVMMVYIEKISKDNKELITTIVGDRNPETALLNMNDVYSAIKTKNDNNYCAKGLGFDSLILVSDLVFDKVTKDKTIEFENRVKEMFEAADSGKEEEFNILFDKLYIEILTSTEEEFNMEYGVGYACMNTLIYFIRSNFEDMLNETNKDHIKYLCPYAEEFGTEYYENSRTTAYYSGMYYLLTDNVKCNTRTK